MPESGPLDGVVVAQYGYEPAIDFAGWLFAQHGAAVWTEAGMGLQAAASHADGSARATVEGGESGLGPTRAIRHADDPRREFCGAGKHIADSAQLAAVLPAATVVIAGHDYDWSGAPNAALTGGITPFGDAGEYAEWVPSEIVLASLGGASAYTRSPDGVPVFGVGERYQYLAGWLLYTALVAELAGHRPSGATRPDVEINLLETVTYVLPYATLQVAYNGSDETIEHSGPRFVIRCLNGHVAVYAGSNWPGFADLIGRPDLRDDPRFVTTGARFAHVAELEALLTAWCADRAATDIEVAALRHSVAVSRVMSVIDVLADPVLEEADMWQASRLRGVAGRIPRLPYRLDGVRVGVGR